MEHLAGIDLTIIWIYVLITVFFGLWMGRGGKDTGDFFLGGRQMPWFAVCLSILATEISIVTFIGVPAEGYTRDYTYLQFAVGSLIGRYLIGYLFLPVFYSFKVTTIYEYLAHRFDEATRVTAVCFFFVTRLLASGVRLLGASIAFSLVTGWSLETAILIAAAVALFYTVWGGIKSIIWTDVVQAVVFLISACAAMFFLLHAIPGNFPAVVETAASAGKMKVFDWVFSLTNDRFFIIAVINGCFMTFAALGTDHDLTQRMLTCKDFKESRKALLTTGFLTFPIVAVFLFIGTLLYVYYLHFPSLDIPENADKIFVHFVVTSMPAGLKGLVIIGVLAAAMSSLDSALGALSSTAVVDIYKPYIKPGAKDGHYLFVSRIFTVLFCLGLVVIAYLCRNFEGILWMGFKIGSFTYGSLLGIFLAGVLTKGGTVKGNLIAMFVSPCIILLLFIFGNTRGVAWPWYIVIGTSVTFFIAWLGGTEFDISSIPRRRPSP